MPAQDDAAEAEDRVDELALRRREGREREVSAVDEPVAVEQHQAFCGHGPSVAADRPQPRRGGPLQPPGQCAEAACAPSGRRTAEAGDEQDHRTRRVSGEMPGCVAAATAVFGAGIRVDAVGVA